MEIKIRFSGHDERRYKRPWIAKVTDWPEGSESAFCWGNFIGTIKDGGVAIIEADPGDVIRYGQRDNEGRESVALYAVVQPDGSHVVCFDAEAARYWQNPQINKISHLTQCSDADLIAEVKRRGIQI